MGLSEGLTSEITRRILLNRERRHHVPACNERCHGDVHFLLPDGPQGSAFSHQSED